jgi:hypothetical protein
MVEPHSPLTDAELQSRTRDLLAAAASISMELVLQTERLAATIDSFNRQIVTPLRELNQTDEEHHHDRDG